MLNTPGVNIGDRQHNRAKNKAIVNFELNNLSEEKVLRFVKNYKPIKKRFFGFGDSDKRFIKIINKKNFWNISKQKFFSFKN